MTYVIALPRVDLLDKTCIEQCPVDCIYEVDPGPAECESFPAGAPVARVGGEPARGGLAP